MCKVEVGQGSYSGPIDILASKDQKITIGKYCSIASDVSVIMAEDHNSKSLSIYPFGRTETTNRLNKLGDVSIGNDVWIGKGVTILGGCRIGDGVIVGAKSLVTSKQNLADYGIYGGIPAKLLRYRFPQETITKLKDLKWWDLGNKIIAKNAELFSFENIDVAIREIERIKELIRKSTENN